MKSYHTPVYNQADESLTSLDYTYAFSKYSCIAWVYPLHIIFAYLVVLSGFLAIISRVITVLTPYHHTFGRWYLIFMLWCMASSLLIHNTGLPLPIIVSFLYMLFSITIGWNAIKLHANKISEEASHAVNIRITSLIGKPQLLQPINIKQIENEERSSILTRKTLFQRLCSYKMLHAFFFTFSWAQMLGRTIVTNPFNSFSGCWTYPSYKTQVMGQSVFPIDSVSTPPFPMNTGTFIAMITAPTVLIILIVGFFVTFCIYRSDLKIKEVTPANPGGEVEVGSSQPLPQA